MKFKTIRAAILLSGAALIAAGCGSGGDDSGDGTVTADGSSTVFPILQAIAEEFRTEHGDVDVSVGTSGTGGGL